jgi:hypothetical protein
MLMSVPLSIVDKITTFLQPGERKSRLATQVDKNTIILFDDLSRDAKDVAWQRIRQRAAEQTTPIHRQSLATIKPRIGTLVGNLT